MLHEQMNGPIVGKVSSTVSVSEGGSGGGALVLVLRHLLLLLLV